MRPRALPRPLRAVATGAAVVGLVLAASSCNAGRPSAARVGDRHISADRLDQVVGAYVEADRDRLTDLIEGDGEDTYQLAAASEILTSLVLETLQAELAEREGARPTEEERQEAEAQVRVGFNEGIQVQPGAEPTPEQAEAQERSIAAFEALPEDVREWLVDLRASTLALARVAGEGVTGQEEQAREIYEADPSQFEAYCLSAIIVEAGDAEAVQARLDAGEDFAEVSSEVTVAPEIAAAGGDLGQCLTTSQLLSANLSPEVVDLVTGLDEGEASEAVDLGDGAAYFFQVREQRLLAFEEVQEEIVASLPDPGEAALAELVDAEGGSIDVRIDPRFGTWDPEIRRVVPPEGATEPLLDEIAGDSTSVPAGG
ncbi:hypothetical protein HC251_06475 [Iamia sp. SCSIO 61187]|uniref:hypothetical protein n=1 Tax=Iamia sp. SCSIO 61187 TaxID=2722752 RepID=UPI001C631A1C|nr:hypothetical protein [Iamia sp. SCSIO 61187]QYG92119.1 hypothetical protein HC251_06475 [Iamia sp. SCSIO 61187]